MPYTALFERFIIQVFFAQSSEKHYFVRNFTFLNPYTMSDFKLYQKKQLGEMRPYIVGEALSDSVSISKEDRENGSPKDGDMIARNPKNHSDQWLVSKEFFEDNYTLA